MEWSGWVQFDIRFPAIALLVGGPLTVLSTICFHSQQSPLKLIFFERYKSTMISTQNKKRNFHEGSKPLCHHDDIFYTF